MRFTVDNLERDLRPFADPATNVTVKAGSEIVRIELIRNGIEYVVTINLENGRAQLGGTPDAANTNRDFPSIRSLLASNEFSAAQILADHQRRMLVDHLTKRFIEPEGTIDGTPLSLTAFEGVSNLDNTTDHAKPIKLILLDGSAGVGKTSLISRLVAARANRYGREGNQPPILHIANRGRRLVRLDELIALSIHMVRGNFTYDQVPALVRNGVIQIAIDGFDELVDADGYADTWSVLREFLKDVDEGGPIILAGRDTFFDLNMFRERLREVSGRVAIRHASLSPITTAAAKAWLQSLGWSKQDLDSDHANELLRDDSYVLRPYFLSTIAPLGGIVPLIEEITSPRDFLVRKFVEREAQLIVQRIDLDRAKAALLLWDLFEIIALEMAESETESVDLPFLQLAVELVFEKAVATRADLSKLRHKAGAFALMEVDARQDYRKFPHTEISNHFLASAIAKEIVADKIPSFMRRGYIGTDFLTVFGDHILSLTEIDLNRLRSRLLELARSAAGSERLSDNSASLLLTSMNSNIAGGLQIENMSAGDVVLFGTVAPSNLNEVIINRLDCRGANLSAINFVNCRVSTLVVDDQTLFGNDHPSIQSLTVEERGRARVLYSPADINVWIAAHIARYIWLRQENESTKLLERVCRVFLRQFFIKKDPLDASGRYLSDPLWPSIEDILMSKGRLRNTDRKDASGRHGEFIHIVNPASLLEASTSEDREIWNEVFERNSP